MFWEGGTRKEPLLSLVEASRTVGLTSAEHQLVLQALGSVARPAGAPAGGLRIVVCTQACRAEGLLGLTRRSIPSLFCSVTVSRYVLVSESVLMHLESVAYTATWHCHAGALQRKLKTLSHEAFCK